MPFTLATTMGLVALAADLPLSVDEATNGACTLRCAALCWERVSGPHAAASALRSVRS